MKSCESPPASQNAKERASGDEKNASNIQIQVRLEGGVRRSNDNIEFPSTLSLDIGQLFADDTVLHSKYIDATHVPRISSLIHPFISPAHNAADTQAKNLLDLDVGLGRLGEEILPKLSYGLLARVHRAIGGGIRVLPRCKFIRRSFF